MNHHNAGASGYRGRTNMILKTGDDAVVNVIQTALPREPLAPTPPMSSVSRRRRPTEIRAQRYRGLVTLLAVATRTSTRGRQLVRRLQLHPTKPVIYPRRSLPGKVRDYSFSTIHLRWKHRILEQSMRQLQLCQANHPLSYEAFLRTN